MQRGIVLGFYQEDSASRAVLKRLRDHRVYRSALLRCRNDGKIRIETDIPSLLPPLAGGLALGLLFGMLLHVLFPGLISHPYESMTLCVVTMLLGGLIAWRRYGIAPVDIADYKGRLARGESLVFVLTGGQDTARILDLMRQHAGDEPVTFAFYPFVRASAGDATDFTLRDPLSSDRLAQQARDLAQTHTHTTRSDGTQPLQRRLKAAERAISRVRAHLSEVARVESSVLLSAEWLLDNSYIIQGQIEDFRRSLPRRYERELPVLRGEEKETRRQGDKEIGEGNREQPPSAAFPEWLKYNIKLPNFVAAGRNPQAETDNRQSKIQNQDLPRVYALARELITGTDAQLSRDNVHTFLQAYQSVTPLTIGELWAVPLMLRLRLIEQLRALSVQVEQRQREREQADFWANRLLTAARRDPDRLSAFLADLVRQVPSPSPHFAEQLVEHLYDEEGALAPVRDWLERRLDMTLADAFIQERTTQAREQVSLGSAINSLRELGRIDYTELFEAVSRIDAILYTDPAGVYPHMDFATRDRYRHAIEEITRRSTDPDITEIAVALKAIEMADAHPEGVENVAAHVGYFLIDQGRPALEAALHSVPRSRLRFQRWIEAHGTRLYIGIITGLTAAIVSTLAIQSLHSGAGWLLTFVLGLFALLPASEVAVQAVNYFVTRLLPPRVLPKMDFEQGVPQSFRTLVVVPMMLLTPESIQDEIDRLEIRYLANSDDNLRYALVSDFSDAMQPTMPEDAERLDIAVRGIEQLNARYPNGNFLLFHRERAWSESEGRWMGWERKRGKLEQLNAFLMGMREEEEKRRRGEEETIHNPQSSIDNPQSPMLVRAGDVEKLRDIRFVITLDADTQLPRDTGRRLVETLAHPLNLPVIREQGGRPQSRQGNSNPEHLNTRTPEHQTPNTKHQTPSYVSRGYAILQPRVSTSLPSATASYFSRLFTDPRGVDPYTLAVSDVYQDLAGEGSYHGKGIYDLAAFHTVLSGRFPTSHLLSHDLIEGSHVRVGLVSDVELFDLFPSDYVVYSSRQHRWIRGDWQIADWLRARVPHGSGSKIPNPLSYFNRWKIFDNLRRSLLPVGMMLTLLLAWLFAPRPAQWNWLVAWTFLTPPALQMLGRVTTRWQRDPLAWKELGTSLVRAALFLALLPHQAWLNLDATVRVWFRKRVSRRLLLEWETASEAHRRSRDRRARFLRNISAVSLFSVVITLVLAFFRQGALLPAVPFLALWIVSPLLVYLLNREVRRDSVGALQTGDRQLLRQVARQTWRFFDDLVTAETHWLPPDNYQTDLRVEIAPRTSPTNIGLGLLALLAAQDMGYVTLDEMVERVSATIATLAELETYEGHLFNWYDIYTAKALPPRYISFVDSGNLLGDLWALNQGLQERLDAPLLDSAGVDGLSDTLHLLRASLVTTPTDRVTAALDALNRSLVSVSSLANSLPLDTLVAFWRSLRNPAHELSEAIHALPAPEGVREEEEQTEDGRRKTEDEAIHNRQSTIGNPQSTIHNPQSSYWAEKLEQQVEAWNALIDRYFPWVETIAEAPQDLLLKLGQDAHERGREAVDSVPSLRTLGSDHVSGLAALMAMVERLEQNNLAEADKTWIATLQDAHNKAQWFAGEKLAQAQETLDRSHTLADAMNLRFLYSPERKSFAIGYNVEDRRLDNFFYDLLASEARLGSFVAIARGQVPVEHWFALGRPFTSAYGQRVLLSWSGTMFEYLMPLLLTKHYENSLLDQGCRAAVACQIAYGRRRGIPWGISEAAYSALDTRQIYQYRAFGVPGLGLKRGLENDLVVAPYATALALPLAPAAAMTNLRLLARREMRGDFGFYESIDFTRQSDEKGDPGVIVSTFMAHHQGMSLLAIDNLLHDDIMQQRFHADPRVRATESLLYERVPSSPPLSQEYISRSARSRVASRPQTSAPVRIPTPDTPSPRTHLLANAEYSVMVTNAGSGYSKWKDFEITRWRADTTRDNYGSFCYVKDLDSGEIWSSTAQPIGGVPRMYSVLFVPEKAEFSRRDADIETHAEIVVSPEDNVEVRRLTFVNHSDRPRRLELTSYAELALAPHAADRAHPAFSKLFVQTEALPKYDALLASRRPRKSGDPTPWAVHLIAMPDKDDTFKQHETDRAKFLGRDGSASRPHALNADLTNSVGAVLDPIFSLRRRIEIPPGERVEVKFVTGAGDSREAMVALADKYCDVMAANRTVELAWTYAQLDLRHLRLQPEEVMRFQQLASYVLYPSSALRANEDRLKRNRLAQPGLWAHGISGDLPIVTLTIGDTDDIDVARQIIVAHNFWRTRGLKCDLVILNEEAVSYEQPLQEQLKRLIQANAHFTGMDQPGGVFVRPSRDIPEEDLTLLLTVARVVLIAARGSLTQQVGNQTPGRSLPAQVAMSAASSSPASAAFAEEPSPPLPFMELPYFNGTGGFTEDGKEYVIYLGPGHQTPLPWINVMANPQFGTLVSESGRGYSWYGNSQSNKLTPWSNDPVLDPLGEAIYIRDEDLGVFWSPTPRPIREEDAYRARHGQGYSRWEHNSHAIEQELLTFVPVDDNGGAPVRIQRLRLHNVSSHRRRLTVTSFAEWTLGVEREDTQMFVVTEWDRGSQTLFARNAYHPDFGNRVAFTTSQPPATSYTGDRAEFLGRNGSAASPAAVKRVKLSNRTGAGLDPCGALQVVVELEPNGHADVIFVLGQGNDANDARSLATRFRNPDQVEQALQATQQWWDKTLETIQVDTPELSVNFLLNRWLLYQDISCRIWGRSAFYQSGGAFGFRDQLQDIMAVLYAHPQFARAQIMLSAAHQFVEGDVQHWWHPPSGAGVRTRISDDLLWLPFVTAQYVRVTGDVGILDEVAPFLGGNPLEPHEHERFNVPEVSKESATLLEHCRRALQKGHTSGPHGLPLIGSGDWNDGLDQVGAEGKGESVWLAWFLVHVLNDFAYLLREKRKTEDGSQKTEAVETEQGKRKKGKGRSAVAQQAVPDANAGEVSSAPANSASDEDVPAEALECETKARALAQAIEQQAWDGAWYRRAYFDDGTPLGSAQNEEAKIDSLPQSWSVISGLGDPDRAAQALQSVEQYLVVQGIGNGEQGTEKEIIHTPEDLNTGRPLVDRTPEHQTPNTKHQTSCPGGMVLLFTPAFDKTPHDPGYIKGYVPGVRENGGQYTHGSLWVPLAFARRGEGDKACHLLRLMNPVEHAREQEGVNHYKVEPYVVVADIYNLAGQEGRGGWSWYTGSAGWMYRVWIEEALGLRKRADSLTINPSIPAIWDGFTLRYRFGNSLYIIRVENPDHVQHGVVLMELEGERVPDQIIPLRDDGKEHSIRVVLGGDAVPQAT